MALSLEGIDLEFQHFTESGPQSDLVTDTNEVDELLEEMELYKLSKEGADPVTLTVWNLQSFDDEHAPKALGSLFLVATHVSTAHLPLAKTVAGLFSDSVTKDDEEEEELGRRKVTFTQPSVDHVVSIREHWMQAGLVVKSRNEKHLLYLTWTLLLGRFVTRESVHVLVTALQNAMPLSPITSLTARDMLPLLQSSVVVGDSNILTILTRVFNLFCKAPLFQASVRYTVAWLLFSKEEKEQLNAQFVTAFIRLACQHGMMTRFFLHHIFRPRNQAVCATIANELPFLVSDTDAVRKNIVAELCLSPDPFPDAARTYVTDVLKLRVQNRVSIYLACRGRGTATTSIIDCLRQPRALQNMCDLAVLLTQWPDLEVQDVDKHVQSLLHAIQESALPLKECAESLTSALASCDRPVEGGACALMFAELSKWPRLLPQVDRSAWCRKVFDAFAKKYSRKDGYDETAFFEELQFLKATAYDKSLTDMGVYILQTVNLVMLKRREPVPATVIQEMLDFAMKAESFRHAGNIEFLKSVLPMLLFFDVGMENPKVQKAIQEACSGVFGGSFGFMGKPERKWFGMSREFDHVFPIANFCIACHACTKTSLKGVCLLNLDRILDICATSRSGFKTNRAALETWISSEKERNDLIPRMTLASYFEVDIDELPAPAKPVSHDATIPCRDSTFIFIQVAQNEGRTLLKSLYKVDDDTCAMTQVLPLPDVLNAHAETRKLRQQKAKFVSVCHDRISNDYISEYRELPSTSFACSLTFFRDVYTLKNLERYGEDFVMTAFSFLSWEKTTRHVHVLCGNVPLAAVEHRSRDGQMCNTVVKAGGAKCLLTAIQTIDQPQFVRLEATDSAISFYLHMGFIPTRYGKNMIWVGESYTGIAADDAAPPPVDDGKSAAERKQKAKAELKTMDKQLQELRARARARAQSQDDEVDDLFADVFGSGSGGGGSGLGFTH